MLSEPSRSTVMKLLSRMLSIKVRLRNCARLESETSMSKIVTGVTVSVRLV